MKYSDQKLRLLFTMLMIFGLAYHITSCKNSHKHKHSLSKSADFSYDEFADSLATMLPIPDTINGAQSFNVRLQMTSMYRQTDYAPLWLSHGYKPDSAAAAAIAELEDVTWDGLVPEQYNIAKLKQLQQNLGKKTTTLKDAIAFDSLLTRSMVCAAKDLLLGRITPSAVDSQWYHVNDTAISTFKKLLSKKNGDLSFSLGSFRSQFPVYTILRNEYKRYISLSADSTLANAISFLSVNAVEKDSATLQSTAQIIQMEMPWLSSIVNDSIPEMEQLLMAYQQNVGLKRTGLLDSVTIARLCMKPEAIARRIAANMERMRWMKQNPGATYILVDVPLMELFFKKGGSQVMHMNVVVGKRNRPTPSLNATMANIVLNPGWGVPPTILKQDVLPGVIKSGSAYLKKKGLKAYDKKGNIVNATTITQKNYRRYQYRQAPGVSNALGYVKFNLPNPWDIYLHDTPHRGDFEKWDRAQSSGCIRLHHPKEMAIYIFNELEGKKYSQDHIDSIIKTHKTQWTILKNKIPVFITYLTAFEDSTGQHVRFSRDIYNRDRKLMALMGS